jgi:hypothetical protein
MTVKHNVVGFEIAMDDAFGVGSGETGAGLACDFNCFVRREASDAPKEACEVLAVNIFHRDEWQAFGFTDVVYAADIGVRDLTGDADF